MTSMPTKVYSPYLDKEHEAKKGSVKREHENKETEARETVKATSKIKVVLPPGIHATAGGITFPVSTSHYTEKTKERLDEILRNYSIDRAVIIAGGGALPLETISKLRENNPSISEVNCVDIDPNALMNLKNIIDIYNSSKSNEDYIEKITKYVHQYDGKKYSRKQIDRWLDMGIRKDGKPDIKGDIELKLINSEIEEFIAGIKDKGKYFIDLSNTVNYIWNFLHKMPWTSIAESKKILDSIIENQNISDGSVVYISNYRKPPLILIKENGKLYQTDPNNLEQNKEKSPLSIVIGLTLDMLYYFAFIYPKEKM